MDDRARDGERRRRSPPPSGEVVEPERRERVDDPQLHVESEPETHGERDPLPDRALLEQDERGQPERHRELEIRVVRPERPERDLERRHRDEEAAEEGAQAPVAPAHEQRVRHDGEGRGEERRRHEERRLRNPEEPEREVIREPAGETQMELVAPDRAVGQNAQERPVFLRVVAQDEPLPEPPPDREADGEEDGGREHVHAHLRVRLAAAARGVKMRSRQMRSRSALGNQLLTVGGHHHGDQVPAGL